MIRAWLELARISNLPTVWTNVLAGWLLAGGKWEWRPLSWLLLGGSLLYTGGMILNDAADVKFDREHRKERPIPSARATLVHAWIVGLAMMALGSVFVIFLADGCAWLTCALAASILFYDLYHKPWAGSVFVMGSCRTLLYLVAASAAVEHLNVRDHLEVIVKAIALGGYVVGLSLVARNEGAAKKPNKAWIWLGLLGLEMPFATWLTPLLQAPKSVATLALAMDGLLKRFVILPYIFLALFGSYIIFALRLMRTSPPSNIGRAVGRLLAGILLVDALNIAGIQPLCALIFALCVPLLLLWQRKIAAT